MDPPDYAVLKDKNDVSFKALLKDPYIVLAAGMIFFSTVGVAMIEPTLAIHMIQVWKSKSWQLGECHH